ncbi:protease [Alcanivorax hongdengensis A-11-3]|uniref:Protease n=1 Tax=Alcanivorax hongdengensis A-11-3 TaxID=1177179 RepID=L0WFB1_9GAMM|nr:M48 family metallopeptidase [Alcanivorax hongdengensis]EKF75726.1 protease [Alcanivorax hongdengensis A-11-3]
MDFFQHQQRARRKTGLLVLYFTLAVLATVACVNLAMLAILHLSGFRVSDSRDWLGHPNPTLLLWVSVITLAVILGGSLLKLWQLRGGGVALANLLHARRIDMASTDQQEKRLINVVEEMSIASGIPTPQLFVLDQETTINAFVAGFKPSETVLVITRGSLTHLNRDELQGVIAHEFSHIFNADMRLNLRLMAILAGILAVGKIGRLLLHSRSRSSSSSNRKGNSLPLVGLALLVIGYVGLFFGRLIKAAISRQRELLADASAVQFTRNPAGLAGALIHIRNDGGSHLQSRHAEDMSHMCFGETVTLHFHRLLATHPPLDARLNALGPDWVARARTRARQPASSDTATGTAPPAPVSAFAGQGGGAGESRAPSRHVATVREEDMGYARTLLTLIPDDLLDTLHDRRGAEQVLYALLLSLSGDAQEAVKVCQPESQADLQALTTQIAGLGSRLRLPLLDLALPTLKALSRQERQALLARLRALAAADRRQSLAEWVLLTLAEQQLGARSQRNTRTRFHRYPAVAGDLQVWFSLLTWASGARDQQAQALFQRASHGLLPTGRTLLPLAQCGGERLRRASERLQALSPLLKAPILDAAADLVLDDGKVQVGEAELLRAFASLLECPLPPLFNQTV